LVLLALALFASGCGPSSGVAAPGEADLANGKKVFLADCSACHMLAEAGATTGTVGPNLDDAYVGPRLEDFKQSSFEALVRQQIAEPDPYGKMPKDIVTGDDARDVAAYVASVAGVQLAKTEKQQNGLTTTPQ
jgi:mono/diheme cytochrome c family protein